ncbi:DUF4857 domain-containing protein [Campylobacter sp.]|uniref:DUF4857 domain-containing protein n=1 Tax=Campylobacter sp. TaxID=205 RepID=UPI00270F422E|nr:DUF4857 domain-containing protein [Campylobacter sp.]
MKAVFLKEISRLGLFFAFLILVLALFFTWFSFDLSYKFGAIHPETVIWYGYVFFDNEPEFTTFAAIAASFICVALAQFLPQRNRIKCLLHLPVSSLKILLWHYLFAAIFFAIIWAVFGAWLVFLASKFYPIVITKEIFINWCYFCLSAAVFYIFASSVLIDKKSLRAAISSVIFVMVCFVVVFYVKSFVLLFALLLASILLGFNALISHKETSINLAFSLIIYAGILAVAGVGGYKFYEQKFANKFERYYIFYSPSLKEFVFQENLGGHYFAYRSASGRVFKNETEYKNELAFNYYMDLKQQGKMPVKIGDEVFDEAAIRQARMSMTYAPKDAVPPKIPLYPLFNPDPKISAIPFSEDMIYFDEDKFRVFHHDGGEEGEFGQILNKEAKNLGVKFPIKAVFGRFTNLKPFDAGLFLKDSAGEFFNVRIYDDKVSFEAVKSLKNFQYLHINESKNSEFLGLGFNEGKIYLFSKNYDLKELETAKFDPATMRLRVSFDPKYLQVRFDDGKDYRAYVFDKNSFEKIGEINLKAK